jgi:hypothetical protein
MQETTTDDPTTTTVETGTVGPAAAGSEQPSTTAFPPSATAPVDEVLRWLANVAMVAGPPDAIDVSTTTRQINVAVPTKEFFTLWQAIVGAVAGQTRRDALGATVSAATTQPGLWSVTIRAHVRVTAS